MKKLLLISLKKYGILFLLLFIANTLLSQTITFVRPTNNDNKNLELNIVDGEEVATDISGTTFEISNTEIGNDIFLSFNCFIFPITDISNGSQGLNLTRDTGIVIATADNSLFSFNGFNFSEIEFDDVTLTLEGFVGNTPKGSVTLDPSVSTETSFGIANLSTAIFGSLDSVTITRISKNTTLSGLPYNGYFNPFFVNGV